MFHQSKLGTEVELQNKHIVLFKSPRDVLQVNTIYQLKGCYHGAKSFPYGHLLIDLTPKIVD